jgi:hypothetical protein
MITHRVHDRRNGNAQSLLFEQGSPLVRFSVGIIATNGKFTGQPIQSIQVVRGELEIDGVIYTPNTDPCRIENGQDVHVVARVPSAYVCDGD